MDENIEIVSVFEPDHIYYKRIVPKEIWMDLSFNGHFMLGAVKAGRPIGCLCFVMDMEPVSYHIVARINWIYVEEEERDGSVEHRLLDQLNYLCSQADVEWISYDASLMPRYDSVVKLFEDSGFRFYLRDNMTYKISVGDVMCSSLFEQTTKPLPVKYLEELSDREFRTNLRKVIMHSDDEQIIKLNNLDRTLYDEKCSCVAIEDGQMVGAILLQTMPSGTVNVNLLYCTGKNPMAWYYSLIVSAMKRALELHPMFDTVNIRCNRKSAAQLISKMYPKAKSEIIRGGICHVK